MTVAEKGEYMRNALNSIIEGFEWFFKAEWYKGGVMGDGILMILLTGAVFVYGGIAVFIYLVYRLLSNLF